MKTLIISSLIFLPSIFGIQGVKADYYSGYNPYRSSYNNWNRSYNAQRGGSNAHLERWNPYRNSYRSWNGY